jgi:hypothetical protein
LYLIAGTLRPSRFAINERDALLSIERSSLFISVSVQGRGFGPFKPNRAARRLIE